MGYTPSRRAARQLAALAGPGACSSDDVFEEDGTYLGEVRAPSRVSLMVFGIEKVWGLRRGELDEPYVVRLQLSPIGQVGP